MARKVLLICGVLASLVYVLADALGSVAWPGYSHMSQGVSELMAIGAPSRPLVLSLMTVHGLLLIAFALGVRQSASGNWAVRLTAILLAADAVVGLTPIFFPVPQRGVVADSMALSLHLIFTAVNVLSILLAMGFAATAFGKRFRLYSIGTSLILLVFGYLASVDAARITTQLPTPWLGITERILIYAYLLWVVVLAATLLRRKNTAVADDLVRGHLGWP